MEELVAQLNAAAVRYLVVGGQAIRLHGLPRFSLDWDFLIPGRDAENLARLNAAIGKWLGEPVLPLGPQGQNFIQTFQTPFGVAQFHLGLPGISSYEAAEKAAVVLPLEGGTPCRVLSEADLLSAKQAAGRPQDELDILFLLEKRKAKS